MTLSVTERGGKGQRLMIPSGDRVGKLEMQYFPELSAPDSICIKVKGQASCLSKAN
jgi:hypothetical protein